MSNASNATPTSASGPFQYVTKPLLHYGAADDTFYVGATRTAHRGGRLQAVSIEDPHDLEPLITDPGTRYDIGRADLKTLIKITWRDVNEATRSQIKANDQRGHDAYASALKTNVESFANNPGNQISCQDIDCNLNILARGHAFPLGTRNTAVPVDSAAVTGLKARAALKWDDNDSRTQLQGVLLSVPCSSYISARAP
jgi:hypothetical protein